MLCCRKMLCVTLISCLVSQGFSLHVFAKQVSEKEGKGSSLQSGMRQSSPNEEDSKITFSLRSAAVGAATGVVSTIAAGTCMYFGRKAISKPISKPDKLYWEISKDPKAVFKSYYYLGESWKPGGLQTIEWYQSHYGLDGSGYYIRGEDDKKYYIKVGTEFAVELPGENRGAYDRPYLLATLKSVDDEILCGAENHCLLSLVSASFDPSVKHFLYQNPSAGWYNWWDKDWVRIFTEKNNIETAGFSLEKKV